MLRCTALLTRAEFASASIRPVGASGGEESAGVALGGILLLRCGVPWQLGLQATTPAVLRRNLVRLNPILSYPDLIQSNPIPPPEST